MFWRTILLASSLPPSCPPRSVPLSSATGRSQQYKEKNEKECFTGSKSARHCTSKLRVSAPRDRCLARARVLAFAACARAARRMRARELASLAPPLAVRAVALATRKRLRLAGPLHHSFSHRAAVRPWYVHVSPGAALRTCPRERRSRSWLGIDTHW